MSVNSNPRQQHLDAWLFSYSCDIDYFSFFISTTGDGRVNNDVISYACVDNVLTLLYVRLYHMFMLIWQCRGGSRGGEKGDYSSPRLSLSLSLSFLAVICSRIFVVEVIFFVFLFLLRMTKGDNKKISKLCFYQKSYHGRKRHHFNHINEPTNTFGQLVIINSIHNIIENVPQTYHRNIDISISTALPLGKAPVLLVFNIFES